MASKRRPGSGAGRPKQPSAPRARPCADSSPDSLESEPHTRQSPYSRTQPAHQAGQGRAEHSGARPGKQSRAEVKGLARTGTGLITDFSRALDDSLHRPEVRMAAARAAQALPLGGKHLYACLRCGACMPRTWHHGRLVAFSIPKCSTHVEAGSPQRCTCLGNRGVLRVFLE